MVVVKSEKMMDRSDSWFLEVVPPNVLSGLLWSGPFGLLLQSKSDDKCNDNSKYKTSL